MHNYYHKWGKLLLLVISIGMLSACAQKAYNVQVHESSSTKKLKGHEKPYSVNGDLYEPLRDHRGYVEEGTASWYGPDFHGKLTSCGEVYDMHGMTSAHKILPMGTMVKVTNLRNNRSVVVRVNDRGPFVGTRIIDLSFSAAKELDIVTSGTAPVRIEAISRADGASEIVLGPFTVQVGAFANPDNAYRLAGQLEKRYGSSSVQRGWVNGTLFYRVRVGSYVQMDEAESVRTEFMKKGTAAFIVALDKE